MSPEAEARDAAGLRVEVACSRCKARSPEIRYVGDDARAVPPEGWSRVLYTRGVERLAAIDLRLLCTRCTNGLGRYLAGKDVEGSRP